MEKEYINFNNLKSRPPHEKRLFQSETIEDVIDNTSEKIEDDDICKMFKQCLPNTLDTAVHYRENFKGNPDTFIITGDIPAMWLRDSTNQIWPYLQFINESEKLKRL
ncbi:MAG: glycoside hydrolase family 125 protein, partial [Candidatus Aenigmatarchaeota archaeon]